MFSLSSYEREPSFYCAKFESESNKYNALNFKRGAHPHEDEPPDVKCIPVDRVE